VRPCHPNRQTFGSGNRSSGRLGRVPQAARDRVVFVLVPRGEHGLGLMCLAWLTFAQAKDASGRSGGVAREKTERGGPLTPERAREARRAVRRAVAVAVVHVWAIVAIVALFDRDLLWWFLALAVLYLVSAPFLLRYLERDIDRRVVPDDASEGMARLAQEMGLAYGARGNFDAA
jgi:hypothetical protein